MRFSRLAPFTFAALTSLSLAAPALAQQRPAPAAESAVTVQTRDRTNVTAVTTLDADETRRQLEDVLKAYPPSLPRIMRMDPTLLNNDVYLQPYPALATFLAQHPEIKHNPQYFLAEYGSDGNQYYRATPQDRAIDMWRNTIEGFTIGTVILVIASGVIWLVKTLIDHRRWSRLSKIQTDVHTKLLDRFSSNEDLLAYIQTPAGRKFLESAPINVSAPQAMSAPLGRILWSAQAGAVLTVLGLGILLVSRTAIEEVAPPLAAMGAVVIALGIGFLVSAFLAYTLTRRFGLMNGPDTTLEPRG
jgi:DNA-directed RNA polymerase subunit H (RpoH/RPB5)